MHFTEDFQKKLSNLFFNPLLHVGHYGVRMTKISILKKEVTIKNFSYERRVYESVDDSSLSYAISQKLTKNELVQQRVKQTEILKIV